jgi:hypothetical protein
MPGGLMQLTAYGAQNVFINGNPSMTYFNKLYKRTTNFAMEHFRLDPRGVTDMNMPNAGQKTFRFKVPNYADMLHDCYLCVNIPDIWSPLVRTDRFNGAEATEFQWVRNLGFNMIEEVAITFNGTQIASFTGEWMKIMSYLKDSKARRQTVDKMVGNLPELYNPANAEGRMNQYPNAIATSATPITAPSIQGRQLTIPLPFWFCQEISQALPLIAMRLSEVEIQVTFTSLYNIFTALDTDPTSSTFGYRIPGSPNSPYTGIQNFLSYPDSQGNPQNSSITSWNLNPYIEANYIFLTDTERSHVAGYERTFLINQVRYVYMEKQYGLNNLLIPMFNLCTRVVALFQRYDRSELNDWDNYTNWDEIVNPTINTTLQPFNGTYSTQQLFTTGAAFTNNMGAQDILVEGNLVFDGKDRFTTKNVNFFRDIQNFRFSSGPTRDMPGIYLYSFALDPAMITQPSGSVNASMFNKTTFQYTLLVPPTVQTDNTTQTAVCVTKDSVNSSIQVPVPPGSTVSPAPGVPPLIQPGNTIMVYSAPTNLYVQFQGYNTIVYIESYNFVKVTNGQANVVFTT